MTILRGIFSVKRPMVWLFFVLLALFAVYCYFQKDIYEKQCYCLDDFLKCSVIAEGTIQYVEEKTNSCYVYLDDTSVRISEKNSRNEYTFQSFLVSLPKEHLPVLLPGSSIRLRGTLSDIPEPSNPGQFDERRYYYEKNIFYKLYGNEIVQITPTQNSVRPMLYWLKSKLRTVYQTAMSADTSGVMCAMLLGDKSLLDMEVKQLYQTNGLGHLLAISGLHISILSLGIYRGCCLLHLKRPVPFIVTALFLVGYASMTGFGIATNRAVIMMFLALLAKEIKRSYDVFTGLAFSALVILLQKPYAITSCSFLLSYASILGICFLNPIIHEMLFDSPNTSFAESRKRHRYEKELKINHPRAAIGYRLYKKIIQMTLDNLCTSIAICLATFPIMLYFYYETATYSVLLNALVLPFSGILLGCGLLGGICGLFCFPAGMLFLLPAEWILTFYEKICTFFGNLPGAVFTAGCPSFGKIAVYYFILIAGTVFWYKSADSRHFFLLKFFLERLKKRQVQCPFLKNTVRSIVCLFLWGSCLLLISRKETPKQLEIILMDVGQGDGILLRTPSGHHILIDGGSSSVSQVGTYRILPCLKYYGIQTLDCMIMTHSDKDHISGQLELMEEAKKNRLQIDRFFLPDPDDAIKNEDYEKIRTAAVKANISCCFIQEKDRITLGRVVLTCLHPKKGFQAESVNGYSTTLFLEYGTFFALFTGDLEGSGEEAVMQQLPSVTAGVNILKIAHHGSKNATSEEFLELAKPEMALISAGKGNVYGHPHKELLQRLEKRKIPVLSTVTEGAVIIECSPNGLQQRSFHGLKN